MVFGPTGVHAQQHLGPILSIGAAGTGIDAEDSAFFVVLTAEQPFEFPAIEPLTQFREALLCFPQHLFIRLKLIQLECRLGVINGAAPVG